MSESCPSCRPIQETRRWKKAGAWVGLLFFCPCHLPLTIAGLLVILSASGIPIAASWGNPLLYGIFGASFVFFLIVLLRMAMRRRDQEREREADHALHAEPVTAQSPTARSTAMEG